MKIAPMLPTVLTLSLFVAVPAALVAQAPPKPNAQMKAVLDSLKSLHPKPIETLTPTEARKQPGPPQAVMALLKKQGKPTTPEPVAKVEDMKIPGKGGQIPIRVYTPEGSGPFPVLVYFHGGGWVIAGIQAYDSSCRALANAAQCVVVSVGYRMAPENRFPAAHEDCFVATEYVIQHAGEMNGDPDHVAVGGESAGGNLATAVCMMARDRGAKMPVYQLLVYPVTSGSLDWPSVRQNTNAKPLNRAMLPWFFKYTLKSPKDAKNPLLSTLNGKVKGLPPATVIGAYIDPLRDEGKAYADKLKRAGIPVRYKIYIGVTHEFFGMGAVLNEAKQATAFAAAGLKTAFAK